MGFPLLEMSQPRARDMGIVLQRDSGEHLHKNRAQKIKVHGYKQRSNAKAKLVLSFCITICRKRGVLIWSLMSIY